MEDYAHYIINNKAAKTRAKSSQKKEALRIAIFNKTGWMPPKSISIALMKAASC